MQGIRDQMGFQVSLKSIPQRIISLVPSQTELLFDLGLADRIVGVTKFCVHLGEAKTKTIVGGTKNFRFNIIEKLQPDLILGNKEENYEEGILQLKEKYPVWISDISSLKDALVMIQAVGEITATQNRTEFVINSIKEEFKRIIKFPELKVLYLIWRDPWMAAGEQTFIHSIMKEIGLVNVLGDERYPELTDKEISFLSPDLVLLSSEPYPFKKNHISELQDIVPKAKILLADGEMFSWYGSRLVKAPAYFNALRNQLS
jgi:ABC-type Fe3+-hydroxamate transport system substrate-binding protein